MIHSNKRIIKLFESVPKFDTYSQYSNSLEKVFHENSFKNLIKNLKEERKPKIYSYFDVDEKKNETNRYNYFRNRKEKKKDDSKTNLLNDEEIINNNNEEKEQYTDNILEEWRNSRRKNHQLHNLNLDPFRYNPNYNSILRRIPCVKITKPSMVNIRRPTTFLTEIEEKALSNNNNNSRNNNPLIKIKQFKTYRLPKLKIKEIKDSKKKFSISKDLNEDKNNHSLRFDKYSDRKELTLKVNPNVSYIEPFDYNKVKNNSIDFNKMHGRINLKTMNKKNDLQNPSVGSYNPHYEYFEGKIRNISLGIEHKNKKNKKYLLKKLWGNYEVRMDYQLIDNGKLKKDIEEDNYDSNYELNVRNTEPNRI
jgi:hypothetical protein